MEGPSDQQVGSLCNDLSCLVTVYEFFAFLSINCIERYYLFIIWRKKCLSDYCPEGKWYLSGEINYICEDVHLKPDLIYVMYMQYAKEKCAKLDIYINLNFKMSSLYILTYHNQASSCEQCLICPFAYVLS